MLHDSYTPFKISESFSQTGATKMANNIAVLLLKGRMMTNCEINDDSHKHHTLKYMMTNQS